MALPGMLEEVSHRQVIRGAMASHLSTTARIESPLPAAPRNKSRSYSISSNQSTFDGRGITTLRRGKVLEEMGMKRD
jgi:hypothetical protein